MSETLNRFFTTGPAVWTGLGRVQQILLLVLGLALPAALFVGSQWLTEGQYVPLFASLTTEDAGAIVNQLKASKVPYRIGGTGEQILVPADRVNELRLKMAVQGLPLGGGVGFEVFDKPNLGVSDFTQRLNYQRALQGELARTIGQLHDVAHARVHLVLPQPSLFVERDRASSASVFLQLKPGGQIGRDEVRGIVHLVASSVEGLTADRVTIVDTSGRVLSVGAENGASALSPRRLEIKAAVEEGMERRLQSLLDAALGPGQAVARVTAQLNFDQVDRTEERFDPSTVARQKTVSKESTQGRSTTPSIPAGIPDGTTQQSAQSQANNAVTSNQGSRETESVTYEVSKVVAHTLTSPGDVQRLSVAVLVNAGVKVTVGPDKKEIREPVPRPPEELEKIRKVVMGAVGFNADRKDEVTVVEMPFENPTADRERELMEAPAPPAKKPWWVAMPVLGGVAAAVLALLVGVVLLLLRGRSRRRALAEVALTLAEQSEAATHVGVPATADAAAAAAHAHAAVAGGPRRALSPTPPTPLVPDELLKLSEERESVRQRAMAMAQGEPDATAQLLRAWMVKKKSLGKGVRDVG